LVVEILLEIDRNWGAILFQALDALLLEGLEPAVCHTELRGFAYSLGFQIDGVCVLRES
jgi:hypothetical protein